MALEYWFMRDLGAPATSKGVANLMSLRAGDVLGHGSVAIGAVAATPAAPADTRWIVYRNSAAVRALIGVGAVADANAPYLPAIEAGDFSNLSAIYPGEVMSIVAA